MYCGIFIPKTGTKEIGLQKSNKCKYYQKEYMNGWIQGNNIPTVMFVPTLENLQCIFILYKTWSFLYEIFTKQFHRNISSFKTFKRIFFLKYFYYKKYGE